ncbi:hypothetical protein FACS1894153_0050 [Bacteroidia bacterium]|nr:hypothetical protein FACS1894153_0050 [Bacteroidia bacterium]
MKKLLVITMMSFLATVMFANNIQILDIPSLANKSVANHTVDIKFGLKWDNSWRSSNPANYDAVWIFCKYWNGTEWHQIVLSDNVAEHMINKNDVKMDYSDEATENIAKQDPKGPVTFECGKSITWLFPESKTVLLDGTPTTNDTVTRTVGVFLYRTYNGKGNIEIPSIFLRWNYGAQDIADDDALAVKVFAIEMVYVPTGKFWIGDKQSTGSARFSFSKTTANCDPFEITSEAAIDFSTTTAANTLTLTQPVTGLPNQRGSIASTGSIPAEFPKGFQAFYIMKYELTQQAYCDFLNTLTFDQQNSMVEANINSAVVNKSPMDNGAGAYTGVDWSISSNSQAAVQSALGNVTQVYLTYVAWPLGYRYGIVYKTIGSTLSFGCNLNGNALIDEQAWLAPDSLGVDGQDVAVTFVSFYDLVRYADFAGLRPMTEFEYEKACRGPASPVANEYAWGGVFIKAYGADAGGPYHWNGTSNTPTSYYASVLSNPMRGNETLPAGFNATNLHYLFGKGAYYNNGAWWWNAMAATTVPSPMRVGAFATATSNRQAAGASYWGVMNMSDNVAELCYTPTTTQGRKFNGTHGGGEISTTGEPMHKADLATEWNYKYKDHWNGNYYNTASTFDSLFVPRGCLTSRSATWGAAGNGSGYSSVAAFNSWRASYVSDLNSGRVADRLYSVQPYNGKERKAMLLKDFGNVSDATTTGWVTYLPGIRCVRTQNAAN